MNDAWGKFCGHIAGHHQVIHDIGHMVIILITNVTCSADYE